MGLAERAPDYKSHFYFSGFAGQTDKPKRNKAFFQGYSPVAEKPVKILAATQYLITGQTLMCTVRDRQVAI